MGYAFLFASGCGWLRFVKPVHGFPVATRDKVAANCHGHFIPCVLAASLAPCPSPDSGHHPRTWKANRYLGSVCCRSFAGTPFTNYHQVLNRAVWYGMVGLSPRCFSFLFLGPAVLGRSRSLPSRFRPRRPARNGAEAQECYRLRLLGAATHQTLASQALLDSGGRRRICGRKLLKGKQQFSLRTPRRSLDVLGEALSILVPRDYPGTPRLLRDQLVVYPWKMALSILKQGQLPVVQIAWYRKEQATFSDVIAFVSRSPWATRYYVDSGSQPHSTEFVPNFMSQILDILAEVPDLAKVET